VREKIARSDIW